MLTVRQKERVSPRNIESKHRYLKFYKSHKSPTSGSDVFLNSKDTATESNTDKVK